jgi:hypothetical protein
MLNYVRKKYADHAFLDVQPGDILIVPTEPVPVSDRLLQRPIREFYPPDLGKVVFVKRHQRDLPGTSMWGWDLSRLGCHGNRASSLVSGCTAGKMPAFRDRLEAYPTNFHTTSE